MPSYISNRTIFITEIYYYVSYYFTRNAHLKHALSFSSVELCENYQYLCEEGSYLLLRSKIFGFLSCWDGPSKRCSMAKMASGTASNTGASAKILSMPEADWKRGQARMSPATSTTAPAMIIVQTSRVMAVSCDYRLALTLNVSHFTQT